MYLHGHDHGTHLQLNLEDFRMLKMERIIDAPNA